ncbi:MAG TPA: DNA-processing protein DprA [Gemmatimonadaceae bacterium]
MVSWRIETLAATAPAYPAQLFELDHPPDPLYAIGDLSLLERPLVSIVGTREATAYGLRTTRAIAGALAEAGCVIVSGLARGIDAAAHRAALESAHGSTIAVLGTGIDVPYPVGHAGLHREICERGLVLSENARGMRAQAGAFPKRNRIIAALGKFTIVVEAGFQSGAQNTAKHVMRLEKTLAAVPGPIDSPQSQGTNNILRDGAHVVSSVADALALAGFAPVDQKKPLQLEGIEARVWSAIGGETLSVDAVAHRADLAARECLTAITALELGGMIETLVTGEVRRR